MVASGDRQEQIELQALATSSARPVLHTICRSFPKISSALSAKVCGGSKLAKSSFEILPGRALCPAGVHCREPGGDTGAGQRLLQNAAMDRDRNYGRDRGHRAG